MVGTRLNLSPDRIPETPHELEIKELRLEERPREDRPWPTLKLKAAVVATSTETPAK